MVIQYLNIKWFFTTRPPIDSHINIYDTSADVPNFFQKHTFKNQKLKLGIQDNQEINYMVADN